LRAGWRGLTSESEAEAAELRDKLDALNALLSIESNARRA